MAAAAGAKRGRKIDSDEYVSEEPRAKRVREEVVVPIEKKISEFSIFYNNINKILEKGYSENKYSNDVSEYIRQKDQEQFIFGTQLHSDVFSKKVIRTNERFFNIMYYLIKKRLYTVNLRRRSREIPIKWINFKSGKNSLITNINEIKTYVNKGGEDGWFKSDSNLFTPNDSITFKQTKRGFEFTLSNNNNTLFIPLITKDTELNTKDNIDNSLIVQEYINTIINELEKDDGERDNGVIVNNFEEIINRLADDL